MINFSQPSFRPTLFILPYLDSPFYFSLPTAFINSTIYTYHPLFKSITDRRGKEMKGVYMKIRVTVAIISALLLGSWGYAQDAQVLKDQKAKQSYVIGVDIGKAFQRQGLQIDPETLSKGIKDGISGGKLLMTDQEVQETMTALQKEMRAKQEEANKAAGERNKKEGEAFLAANSKKEGVKTLPSGVQYKVIKAGTGKKPQATDTVLVHYRGTLIDGTEFDSSQRRGQPLSIKVNGVIPGWTEGLQLMEEGAKWNLYIPPNHAYGDRGAGPQIGPNAVLIFEVELISVQPGK
jgi:FKBP-type peptidyl-prolyl cis-trans isomerase FklB